MADSVKAADGTLFPFNQKDLQGVGSGQCYGLALAWLGYQRNGASTYFTEIHQNAGALRQNATRFFHSQNSPSGIYKENGLGRSVEKTGDQTQRYFRVAPGVGQKGLAELGDWLCGTALTQRYFLISTPKHTMACVSGGISDKRYFDPNAGVGTFSSGDKLKTFITDFFAALWANPATREMYWGATGEAITVVKLTKA